MYRVIIADDEPIMRNGMKTLIDWQSLDCELLYAACDGLELKDKIDALLPDIVISDIKMPGLDGIAVAAYLYETHPEIKLILLTGYADFSYAKSAIRYKVTDYVTKTGALEGVIEAVEKAKAEVRAAQAERAASQAHSMQEYLRAVFEDPSFTPPPPAGSTLRSDLAREGYRVLSIGFLPNDKLEHTPQGKLTSGMTNFLDMSFQAYRHYTVALNYEEFCMIVCGADREGGLRFRNVCGDVVDTVTNFMNLKIMLGVSRRHSGADELHGACAEARGFLSRYFIDQYKKTYYADEPEDGGECAAKPDAAFQRELTNALQEGDRSRALACFDRLFCTLKDARMQSVKSAGIVLLSACDNVLAAYHTDTQRLTGRPDLSSDILKCKLLAEFSGILRAAVEKAADHISGFVQNQNAVVLEADRYIRDHYCENVELGDIAAAIHVNPSYLSRVYRKQTGKTVMTALNEKKIDKAKDCLLYTNMKAYEIAEAIGINDTAYFSHFFNKHTGLSPREFKSRFRKEQRNGK